MHRKSILCGICWCAMHCLTCHGVEEIANFHCLLFVWIVLFGLSHLVGVCFNPNFSIFRCCQQLTRKKFAMLHEIGRHKLLAAENFIDFTHFSGNRNNINSKKYVLVTSTDLSKFRSVSTIFQFFLFFFTVNLSTWNICRCWLHFLL